MGRRPNTETSVACQEVQPSGRGVIVMICGSQAVNWNVLRAGNNDFYETKAACDQWQKAGSLVTVRSGGAVDTGLRR